jgi:hypothetical protein
MRDEGSDRQGLTSYEAPKVTVLGSVEELTQGKLGKGGDGGFFASAH